MNDQRSLAEQLHDLEILATRSGMYDAADFIRARLTSLSSVARRKNMVFVVLSTHYVEWEVDEDGDYVILHEDLEQRHTVGVYTKRDLAEKAAEVFLSHLKPDPDGLGPINGLWYEERELLDNPTPAMGQDASGFALTQSVYNLSTGVWLHEQKTER